MFRAKHICYFWKKQFHLSHVTTVSTKSCFIKTSIFSFLKPKNCLKFSMKYRLSKQNLLRLTICMQKLSFNQKCLKTFWPPSSKTFLTHLETQKISNLLTPHIDFFYVSYTVVMGGSNNASWIPDVAYFLTQ